MLSPAILSEFFRVISSDELLAKQQRKGLYLHYPLLWLLVHSRIVRPVKKLHVVAADPDDDRILECAFEGGADIIVSRDAHLLNVKQFRGIPILTPEEFLAQWRC